MSTTSKKITLLVATTIIAVLIAKFAIPWERFGDQQARAQEIRMHYSDEPAIIVDMFLHALIDNNVQLAKELVIPEQQERINRWKVESNHKAFKCPPDWKYILNDPFEIIAGGGISENERDSITREVDSSYHCENNNRQMRVTTVVIKFDGAVWIITDWGMICETPPSYNEEETCYR